VKPNKKTQAQQLHNQFPCSQCGAMLRYQPGSKHQACDYCGQDNEIVDREENIQEYNLHDALVALANASANSTTKQAHCNACGASFKFAANLNAGQCPFCDTDIVISPQKNKLITPKSLLPFVINQSDANKKFHHWIQSLWFAPNKVYTFHRKEPDFQDPRGANGQ
jgi:LSD1 subclass zinc finger protein